MNSFGCTKLRKLILFLKCPIPVGFPSAIRSRPLPQPLRGTLPSYGLHIGSRRCASWRCCSVGLRFSFPTLASIGAKLATHSHLRSSNCRFRLLDQRCQPAMATYCPTRTGGAAISISRLGGLLYWPVCFT